MSSSPKTRSCPLTSSRLKRPSRSAAYGGRLERKRFHTEVSTRTIIRSRDWLSRPVRVAGESRERVAQIHEAPVAARTRRVERAPQDQDEPCRYLSLHRRLTWRCATAGRRYGGASSYIRLCPRCMAVVAGQRGTPILIKRRLQALGSVAPGTKPARHRRSNARWLGQARR